MWHAAAFDLGGLGSAPEVIDLVPDYVVMWLLVFKKSACTLRLPQVLAFFWCWPFCILCFPEINGYLIYVKILSIVFLGGLAMNGFVNTMGNSQRTQPS